MTTQSCFICGNPRLDHNGGAYQRCGYCGHETLIESQNQGYIINDPLTIEDVETRTKLDTFKDKVMRQFFPNPPPDAVWVDVGSGSGKYLYQNRALYRDSYGLEITPSAVEFSRKVLGLNILEDAKNLPRSINLITAWHSLEHFPAAELQRVLVLLSESCNVNSRFVISIPNVASFQCKLFGESYAFTDIPSHLHQFSPKSLDTLMSRYGFKKTSNIISWPYNIFGYVQGLLNFATGTHNYVYFRIKRKNCKGSFWQDFLNLALVPIFGPLGILLSGLDALNPNLQGVLTVCYKKDH